MYRLKKLYISPKHPVWDITLRAPNVQWLTLNSSFFNTKSHKVFLGFYREKRAGNKTNFFSLII